MKKNQKCKIKIRRKQLIKKKKTKKQNKEKGNFLNARFIDSSLVFIQLEKMIMNLLNLDFNFTSKITKVLRNYYYDYFQCS